MENGFDVPTVLEAVRDEFGADLVTSARGCAVDDDDRSGFDEAVAAASAAEVAVLVLGDHAGLFGGAARSAKAATVTTLELPRVQRELAGSGTGDRNAVVLVLLAARPYAVDWRHWSGAPRWCRRSSSVRKGSSAIAGSCPDGSTHRANCRSACLVRPVRSRTRYLHPTLGGGDRG